MTNTIQTHSKRLSAVFESCKQENRAALVTFIMSGDPDLETSQKILKQLPSAGADIIELGMPFTDPMADGTTIQAAGRRALNAGQTLQKTLNMVHEFRQSNGHTPIILMGYYNPIYAYGVDLFLEQARKVGVDGLIIVDLPIEEDAELRDPSLKAGLDFIRLTTPTTAGERLKKICDSATGFVYHVGIAGITGTGSASQDVLEKAVKQIKACYQGSVCIGFGIKTPDDVKQVAQIADGVVVGSAIIELIANGHTVEQVCSFVESLRACVQRQNKEAKI